MMTSKSRAVVEGRPPSLTNWGKEIASFMNSCEWCGQALKVVEPKVRHRRVSSEASRREVHKLSRRYIYSRLSPTLKGKIKKCASVKGITVEDVRCVLAVQLREVLFIMNRLKGRTKL